MFGKRNGGGRRNARREKLATCAVLTTMENSQDALLADLSSTGARLRGTNLPSEGEAVSLRMDCVRAFGIVTWSANEECGIAFDASLASFEVERLQREVKRSARNAQSLEVRLAFEDWNSGFIR